MILHAPGLAFALALALPVVAAADGIDIGIPTTPDMIDTAWGSSGYVSFTDQSITAKALDTDRRLLIAGQSGSGSLVRRLLVNGQPDTSFGNNGSLAISLGSPSLKDRPAVIIPLADGSFYLLINHDMDSSSFSMLQNYSLVYASTSGSIIGINKGVRFTGDGFLIDAVRDVEGRIYLLSTTGFTDPDTGIMEWTLQRLMPDSSLDTSFSNDGAIHWSSNYASVIGMFVGEHLQARYFDPDNPICQVRALSIAENGDTTEQCGENATGRPVRLFSVPTLQPDKIEDTLFAGTNSPLPEGALTIANESVNLQVYPLGFLQIIAPTQIGFNIFNPYYNSTEWNFNSEAHAAMTTNATGTMAHPDADGGVYISFNNFDGSANGYLMYSPPATIFRSKGLTLDTLPDPVSSPTISVAGAYYVSTPFTIAGLGNYVSVPARINGGEISLDGTNWHKGWVWVHNGSQVRGRYSNTATMTIGGIISPNNPSLPVGNVLTLSFTPAVTTPDLPIAEPVSPAGGGSGGSTDLGFLMFAGLLALLKARRKSSASGTQK